MNLNKIDKNFETHNYDVSNLDFLTLDKSFYYGVYKTDLGFSRINPNDLDNFNDNIRKLSNNTSGGRICFSSDSRYIYLNVKMPEFIFPMMAESSASGFDAYVVNKSGKYTKLFVQPYKKRDNGDYSSLIDLKDNTMKNIIISMPLYNSPKVIDIKIEKTAIVKSFSPYKGKPICFYGSSITQGCCASRPSFSYPMLLSKKFGFDFVNLGFSGNARGEIEMAKYISSLHLSGIVLEYDHNSSIEELKSNYKKFVQSLVKKSSNLNILLSTRFDFKNSLEDKERKKIIFKTYKEIKKNYSNIFFLDGGKVYSSLDECTVDGTHPNDLGLSLIAKSMEPFIKKCLKA